MEKMKPKTTPTVGSPVFEEQQWENEGGETLAHPTRPERLIQTRRRVVRILSGLLNGFRSPQRPGPVSH